MLRVAHYLNQFFGGLGAEEQANVPPEVREGPVGPGRALAALLGAEGGVISTLICGDNFFNEQADSAHAAVRVWLREVRPSLVVAGPAFAAGRYGSACAQVCALAEELGIPAVTGMHPENPGRLVYQQAYVVPTSRTAAGMAAALRDMLALGRKLAAGGQVGPAEVEGYLPRGRRLPGDRGMPGAERAVEMLVAKLAGRPYRTEIPVAGYDRVPPAPPVPDLRQATLALATTGAIVPRGNPDHLRRCSETRWVRYSLDGREALSSAEFECVHGGFYNIPASENPNLVLPLDAVRTLQREGAFARLLDVYLTTTGNDMRLADCQRNGREMARTLREAGVDAALLVAT